MWCSKENFQGRFGRLARLLACLAFLWAGCQDSHLDTLLEKANEEWLKGRNHSAVELFRAVLEASPSGVYAEEALFRLGEIYLFGLDDHIQAINYFKEVARENPKGRFGYDARKYIAWIVETHFRDYDQAIIEYQNLINNFPMPEENAEHQFHIATIFMKKQNYEQALVELDTLLERYPNSTWAEQAEYKIVEIQFSLNQCNAARASRDKFLGRHPMSRFRGEMEFIMASCLEEEGKLEKAYQSFKGLKGIYKYPTLVQMKLESIEKRINKKVEPAPIEPDRKRRRRS